MIEEKLKKNSIPWPDTESQAVTIKDYEKFFALSQDMSGVDGFFEKVNQSFERVLGYTLESQLGKGTFAQVEIPT